MNRPQKLIFAIIGTLILVIVTGMFLLFYVYHEKRSNMPPPVYSVDGSRVIIPTINSNKDDSDTYLLVHIEVQDVSSGETLFRVQTRASDRMRWSVAWIDDNTVVLNSSDIGSYCWMENKDGMWADADCP